MKLISKNHRLSLPAAWLLVAMLFSSVALTSCKKEPLEIQQGFPFEVEVMPVPAEVKNGQTVEIRMTIIPEGNYSNTGYFIRYFQLEGTGILQYYNEPPYLPNDLYPLAMKQFRLYYTSQSVVSQSFDVWISDSFGNEKKLSFTFDSGD